MRSHVRSDLGSLLLSFGEVGEFHLVVWPIPGSRVARLDSTGRAAKSRGVAVQSLSDLLSGRPFGT